MAHDSLSAHPLPADDPFFNANPNQPVQPRASPLYGSYETSHEIHEPRHGEDFSFNPAASGFQPEAHSAFYPEVYSPYNSQEMTSTFPGSGFPSVLGNLQDRPGGSFEPSLAEGTYFSRPFTNQTESMLPSRGPIDVSQPNSVKHLTCWYWANGSCRLSENMCLYSHYDTGRVAEPPIQRHPGRESTFHQTFFTPKLTEPC